MDANQIIILLIVILLSIIIVTGVYFLISSMIQKKKIKEDKATFNPEALIEHTALIDVMEEKRRAIPSVDNDKIVAPKEKNRFLNDQEPIIRPVHNTLSNAPKNETIVDPFHMKFDDNNNKNENEEIFNVDSIK